MGFIDRLKSIFRKNNDPQEVAVEEISLESYAHFPLFLMLSNEKPFSDWKTNDVVAPNNLAEFYKTCVNIYQMFTFYIMTVGRFGEPIAEIVLRTQVSKLNKGPEMIGNQLEAGIRQIYSKVSSDVKQPMYMDIDGQKVEIPLEHKIAIDFLILGDEAPFATNRERFEKEGVPPEMGTNDIKLARCLEHGKATAIDYFKRLETVQVLFDNLTVENIRAAICDKSFLEVSDYWEALKDRCGVSFLLAMNQRLYELALWDQGVPAEERKLAFDFAEAIGGDLETYFTNQNAQDALEAFRAAVAHMKESGNIDRP